MKKLIVSILILFAGSSCEVDYNMGDIRLNEPECIIVNSILCLEKPVEIQSYRLQKSDKRYDCTGLTGTKVTLK